jgi:hypothetical protein
MRMESCATRQIIQRVSNSRSEMCGGWNSRSVQIAKTISYQREFGNLGSAIPALKCVVVGIAARFKSQKRFPISVSSAILEVTRLRTQKRTLHMPVSLDRRSRLCILIHIRRYTMRTNIVLDDALVQEALKLSGKQRRRLFPLP